MPGKAYNYTCWDVSEDTPHVILCVSPEKAAELYAYGRHGQPKGGEEFEVNVGCPNGVTRTYTVRAYVSIDLKAKEKS